MLAAASRYVLRPRPSQQHIAESSSTDLGRPWHVEMTCQCAGARRQAAEKTQHPLDPVRRGVACVRDNLKTPRTTRRRANRMIAGRAAVSVDRLIMRADTLRESTRDLCSVWPP